jgi:tRNA modification GTPase
MLLLTQGPTIVAIATAIVPAQGSVGIVRLSGTTAVAIARAIFRAPGHQPWESHRILYGWVCRPDNAAVIATVNASAAVEVDQSTIVDEALLMLMLAPRSYTREDVVELHCHGGMMAVQQVLQLCLEQGARLAEPGEFTLRAFLNGRLDLTQAESVMDLVGAKSAQAAQTALAGLQGKLAQPIRELRSACLDILAEVEARIDFEDDLAPLDEARVQADLAQVLAQVSEILASADRGELLRSGLKVAIVGQPNVGKSSLLNAWSRSDRAIVTDLPGTTRDVVESQLVVGGIPIQVLDTAGIRETTDTVEKIGVARSRAAAQAADLVLLTVAADQGWTAGDQAIYEQVADRPVILVINKIDLMPDQSVAVPAGIPRADLPIVRTAAAQNQGIGQLEQAILAIVGRLDAANLDMAINQRQAAVLTRAKLALEQVQLTMGERLPLDFWTIDLRLAIQALGEILGEDVTESVLERIFNKFCIGK